MVNREKRVNGFAQGGEKARIGRKIQDALKGRDRRYSQEGKTGEEVREKILKELKPVMETKSVKRSGISQQVPTPVSDRRGRYRACKWIREAAQKRSKKRGASIEDGRRLELVLLYEELKRLEKGTAGIKRQSEPRQRRDRMHRVAKANRVFSR
jgi:ribosomal protein S7